MSNHQTVAVYHRYANCIPITYHIGQFAVCQQICYTLPANGFPRLHARRQTVPQDLLFDVFMVFLKIGSPTCGDPEFEKLPHICFLGNPKKVGPKICDGISQAEIEKYASLQANVPGKHDETCHKSTCTPLKLTSKSDNANSNRCQPRSSSVAAGKVPEERGIGL